MGCVAKSVCFLCAVIGVCLVAVGVGLMFYFQTVIKRRVDAEVVIRNGSQAYEDWVKPPAPVYLQFYIFDVKNAYEIVNKGDKPIVFQKGPYSYREIRNKEDVVFHDNGTVSYVQPKIYTFVSDMSAGNETDEVTTPNVPLVFIAQDLHKILSNLNVPSDVRTLIENAAKVLIDAMEASGIEPLFKTLTVYELIWGYDEPILHAYNVFRNYTFQYLHLQLLDETFGLFSKPGNGSDDGNYTVYTGEKNVKLVNTVNRWNGLRHLDYWNSTYCNMINGTDGSVYHPFISKQDTLYIFSTDICRSIYAVYERDTVVENIALYRFIAPKAVFEDHVQNPANEGFCVPDCLGSGVLHLSACKEGAPIVASQPHFYQAAEKYIDGVIGMKPNKEEHETFLEVEPITGVGMHLSKKLQINVLMKSVPEVKALQHLDHIIFPILWVNESARVDKASAHTFKYQVYQPIQLTLIAQYSLMGLGAFVCFCVFLWVIVMCAKSKPEPLHVQDAAKSDAHRGLLNAEET